MDRLLTAMPNLSSLPLIRSVPHNLFSRDMVAISSRTSGLSCGTATSGAGLPAPEEAPALPVPAHHRVGCDDPQMLPPAGTPSARQDPEQLVPGEKPHTWSGSSGASQDGELLAQEQVLEHEVLARACPGQDGREQQPEES